MSSVRDDGDVCARAEGEGGDPFAGHTRPRAGLEYSIGDAFDRGQVVCERGFCGPAVTVQDGGEGAWAKIIAIAAGPDMETAHANARLIAAAPALLAERDRLRADLDYSLGVQMETRAVARRMADAIRHVLPDLENYASRQGPGPDRRLAALREALGAFCGLSVDGGAA